MPFKDHLTVKQLSELTGTHPDTLRDWAKKRKLPHLKWGSRYLFHKDILKDMEIKAIVEKLEI